jgi:uncharacterized protein (DUF1499 family)
MLTKAVFATFALLIVGLDALVQRDSPKTKSSPLAPVKKLDTTFSKNTNIPRPLGRREALALTFGLSSSAFGILSSTDSVHAFENRISEKYNDRPKQRGPMPNDLGVAKRTSISLDGDSTEYDGLKGCRPAPNCFSSSLPVEDDPNHSIPAWVWPKELDKEQAFQNLNQVLLAYPPGQSGVDGGGFEIKTFDPKGGYIYVQFQALKNGYIDDVEFATVGGDRTVQVRSSSRIGYLDFGVNAKRINCITKSLRSKGWDAVGVDFETHKGYSVENEL